MLIACAVVFRCEEDPYRTKHAAPHFRVPLVELAAQPHGQAGSPERGGEMGQPVLRRAPSLMPDRKLTPPR